MDDLKEVILQTLEELEEDNEVKKVINKDEEFLKQLRERILVLFEGLQSPNVNNIEKKLDLTINYLEYILSDIDKRLQNS